jgi:glycosyltransferase involved in cell wall biosynthesis
MGLAALAVRGPLTLLTFVRLLGRERPDVVHVNDLYDFLPAAAARFLGIPVVYHLRMIQTRPRVRAGFARLVPRLSDVTVSVSRAVRDHYFNPSDPRHHVIHDLGNADLAVDLGDVSRPGPRPAGLEGGDRLIVMVGRIETWKGPHVFIDAVRLLSTALREQHHFALVGGAVPGKVDFHDQVVAHARDLGITVLGTREDVPAILRAADVSVHCSVLPDPFPGVVVESLLAGAATIGAEAGGVPEMIDSQAVGVLVPPNDPEALASELTRLLSGTQSPRATYGPKGRVRALELVDPIVVDARVGDLYRSLAAKSRAGLPSLGE